LYRLRSFANPENRAVLADFLDFPAVRAAEFFCANRQLSFNKFSVLLEKYFQHRLPNQLRGGIAKLRGAKAVYLEHWPGWPDHEIHRRIMFENLAPLLIAFSQRLRRALAHSQKGRRRYRDDADNRIGTSLS